MTQIRRVPLRKRDLDELNRSVNILSFQTHKDVEAIEEILTVIILISREYGGLRGNASEAVNGDIEAWDVGEAAHAESLLTVDPVTGEITIGADGVYQLTANLVYTGSGNNVQYGLGFRVNGVAQPAFSYNLWTNQTAAQSFTGVGARALSAGDVINLTKTNGNAMTNISGNVTLELKIPT